MLTYRPVTPDDLSTICTFALSAKELYFFHPKAKYPLTKDQLSQTISQRVASTVIELNNELVGFANFYQWQQNNYCKIGNVIINPKFRQQGIANFLIHTMIKLAKE